MNALAVAPWTSAPWTPRAWQAEALPVVMGALRSRSRGVVSACTGSGKSILQSEVCHQVLAGLRARGSDGWIVLVTVPSQDLVEQLARTLRRRCGRVAVGRWYGKRKELRSITVCCLASLATVADAIEAEGLKVAVWMADECHKTYPDEVQAQVERLGPVARVGFTATPFRSCHHEYLRGFDEVVYRYLIGDAIRDGALVPFRVVRWRGEEVPADDACVEMIREHGDGPGIVSASSIADADDFAARLAAEGMPALSVHSGLTPAERASRLRMLEEGELQALVHVALLVEGVDYPWLRWLCLRRETGSPVRVVQEIGRVLRTCEGKTEAVILDPLDVLGKVGIRTDAAFEAQVERLERALEREAGQGQADDGERKVARAVAIADVEGWLADLLLSCQAAGLAEPDKGSRSGRWRAEPTSEGQRRLLAKWAGDWKKAPTRYLPKPARAYLKTLIEGRDALSKGAASDLISILIGVQGAAVAHAKANAHVEGSGRWWRWPASVTLPDLDASAIRLAVEAA